MGRRVAVVLLLALLAQPAAAEGRSIRVEDRSLAQGEAVRIGGTGWDTAIGFCAADEVDVELVRNRRRWRLGRVATELFPFSGTWSIGVRIPQDASLGPARIEATQRVNELRGDGRCRPRRLTRASVGVVLYIDPRNRCEEPECTPTVLRPRIGINRLLSAIVGQNAFWTSLEETEVEPAPGGCFEPPCMGGPDETVLLGLPLVLPGVRPRVVGDTWDIPEGCPDRLRFALLDARGTGHALGTGNVDAEGRFAQLLALPATGVAPGRARLMAATAASGPGCALVATLDVQVVIRRPTVWMFGAEPPAARTVEAVRGLWWGTDRCDGPVEILLSGGSAQTRVLERLRPAALGSFDVKVRLPSRLPRGARLSARQVSRREVAGVRGRARTSRCRGAGRRRAEAARPFPTTLEATLDGNALTVTGAGWNPAECGGRDNPVSVEALRADGATPLGLASPREDLIEATFVPEVPLEAGATVRASQAGCDPGEPPLTETAVVEPVGDG